MTARVNLPLIVGILVTILISQTEARYSKATKLEKCGGCDKEKCPPVNECPLGKVLDRCDCCEVCGLEEYQLCNLSDDYIALAMGKKAGEWHGKCGHNLECRVRRDVDPEKAKNEAICYCKTKGVVCASNGKTYSKCAFEAAANESKKKIKKISDGPCKAEPKIESISKPLDLKEGSQGTLMCEVQGYPLPNVLWYFNKHGDKEKEKMPNDSDEISVSLRGGPQMTYQTSHLQISEIKMEHEGVYTCMAENDLGMQVKTVSLTVKPSNSRKSDL